MFDEYFYLSSASRFPNTGASTVNIIALKPFYFAYLTKVSVSNRSLNN